jgi:hypothetical protein
MRILKNQPTGTSLHLVRIWPGERGANLTSSVLKDAVSRLADAPKFEPFFPKNSGWINKTYQRISLFGKSPRRNPLSGTVPDDVSTQQIRWEKTLNQKTLTDYSKL